jgi:probable phosphoglycerate mutase
MEKFYFVRHGETEANLTRMAAGCGWDVELNETGQAQAKALAESERLAQCKDVTTIYVSPLARARQTAEVINTTLQKPIEVIDALKEWDLGDWERQSWANLPDLFHPDSNPPNGESQLGFGQRVAMGLSPLLAKPGPVMLVAHGGVWHALSRILSLPFSSVSNCALIAVSRSGPAGEWILEQ